MIWNPVYEKIVDKKKLRIEVDLLMQADNEIIAVTPFEYHDEWFTVQRYLILWRKRDD